MRIVFFGIYQIGLRSLQSLVEGRHHIVAVVTKPHSNVGRQPVADFALERGLKLLQPERIKGSEFASEIAAMDADLICVAGYHLVIPEPVLQLPRKGTLNLHGSMLPKYRGPCSWKWVLINGESETGVTVHMMTAGLDKGDILAQEVIAIGADDTGGSLFLKASEVGARLLNKTVASIETGSIVRRPQNESEASYFGYPTDDACRINWSSDAVRIDHLVRGLNPRPGAWFSSAGHRARVWRVSLSDTLSAVFPGTVVAIDSDAILVATGSRDLVLTECALDGQIATNIKDIVTHLGIRTGSVLDAWQ